MNKQTTKERPILFSGPMVRAILEGRKTQTRRIIKGLPSYWSLGKRPLHPSWTEGDFAFYDMADPTGTYPTPFTCPFGRPGDLLWVREAWRPRVHPELWDVVEYRADGVVRKPTGLDESAGWKFSEACDAATGKWRPSIHMPRWASRITLRLTDVRVARLQEIKLEECADEGAPPTHPADNMWDSVDTFKELWNARHKQPYQWSANPWVWVLTHERVKGVE